ncbi:hypothetical protein [Singulisphaera sp. PoT]|uniref:hypothetical protein n=1 Tax=Singulisphaera sp. PoT TaxID=3411797 RepID=UPI003BF5E307
MQHYRTEVVIPADRYIYVQLPERFREGRAIVTVHIQEDDSYLDPHDVDMDDDHLDIEWWEEFEGDRERVPQRMS